MSDRPTDKGNPADDGRVVPLRRPETAMQALMEAVPGFEPEESTEDDVEGELSGRLQTILLTLTPTQLRVVEALSETMNKLEVAKLAGCSRQFVYQTIRVLRKRMEER